MWRQQSTLLVAPSANGSLLPQTANSDYYSGKYPQFPTIDAQDGRAEIQVWPNRESEFRTDASKLWC